jgi:hypothetical protein
MVLSDARSPAGGWALCRPESDVVEQSEVVDAVDRLAA